MSSIKYTLIRTNHLFSGTSISISSKKGVVVRAPLWVPQAAINNFISEKSEWINKHLQRLSENKIVKQYVDGEKHLFFGTEFPLVIKISPTPQPTRVQILDKKLQVEIYAISSQNISSTKIKEALLYWYLEKGIETITEKVNYYSSKMGVSYSRISLKNVTSIWGSCSPSNCLSFNRKLVMAPQEVVDYVVIHEVSHMVHRNHSQDFWNLVSLYDQNHKAHRRWLKQNHHLLTI